MNQGTQKVKGPGGVSVNPDRFRQGGKARFLPFGIAAAVPGNQGPDPLQIGAQGVAPGSAGVFGKEFPVADGPQSRIPGGIAPFVKAPDLGGKAPAEHPGAALVYPPVKVLPAPAQTGHEEAAGGPAAVWGKGT